MSARTSPRVSVCMPVYNAARYVAEAAESVLSQTFRDFELLAVDDGSTDGSSAILAELERRDPRVVLLRGERGGQARARNRACERARGEYLALLDADDVARADRLERQVDYLDRHPEVVCVSSAFAVIDARGRYLTQLDVPLDDATIQKKLLAGHGALWTPSACLRAEALRRVGGFDERLRAAEDLDLWLKLGELGRLANLPEPLVRYRLVVASVSERHGELQRDEARRVCERAWARRGIRGVFEATEPWRPGPDRGSRASFLCKYGWWAWQSGERRTAARYGARAVRLQPWRGAGWRLLLTALRKRPPGRRAGVSGGPADPEEGRWP